MNKQAFNEKYNGKFAEVVKIYYVDKEYRDSVFLTGLVIELDDGRFLEHSQDGFVTPFSETGKVDDDAAV